MAIWQEGKVIIYRDLAIRFASHAQVTSQLWSRHCDRDIYYLYVCVHFRDMIAHFDRW